MTSFYAVTLEDEAEEQVEKLRGALEKRGIRVSRAKTKCLA